MGSTMTVLFLMLNFVIGMQAYRQRHTPRIPNPYLSNQIGVAEQMKRYLADTERKQTWETLFIVSVGLTTLVVLPGFAP